MFNILVADDEINILNLYKIRLAKQGFNVLTALDGEKALDVFYNNKIDLVILDIMMPKLNGLEVIKDIRANGYRTPSIIVSARGELNSKIQGFNNGIDDYIIKPFEFEELVIRIHALLRRSKITYENQIVIGDTTLDYDNLTISNNMMSLRLRKKDFQIIFKLLSYPEKIFSKDDLFEEFWGLDSDADSDIVKVYISKIRNQIKDFKDFSIETVRGIGYQGVKYEENKKL